MPAQNLELQLQKNSTIKLLNMEPTIAQNWSNQQLVSEQEESRGLRSITAMEWISIGILCFVNLINYMDRFTVAGILPDIQESYKIGNSEGGLLQTVFILSYMVFAPIFGYLGDRYSRKRLMAFGVFLWSITTLLGSFMNNFGLFLMCRAMVGIGEASYSTVAPTIISDLFVKDLRSKMLALFYFAIPVGSGLGYIIGSSTAHAAGSWHWGLRVTPILGGVAVILILLVLKEPTRGLSEGGENLIATSWVEDVRDIVKNPSFMFTTAGFTCVAFAAGALSWWGPTLLYLGVKLQPGNENIQLSDLSFPFGVVAMLAGVVGVSLGVTLSQYLKERYPRVDPLICAFGLVASSPLLIAATYLAPQNTYACLALLFLGEVAMNLNWSLVCDIVLYVVVPTRRSTAQGFQLLVAHAFGDAGSPYIIGLMSDSFYKLLSSQSSVSTEISGDASVVKLTGYSEAEVSFKSLQYSIFLTNFVEILGGVFFLIVSVYVVKDRMKVEKTIREAATSPESLENNEGTEKAADFCR